MWRGGCLEAFAGSATPTATLAEGGFDVRKGRFQEPFDPAMRAFNSSLAADRNMLREDIEASQAHARELGRIGVLTAAEVAEILDGLDRVLAGVESGDLPLDPELEDIHMNVEVLLGRFTKAAGRLHTARSRNDQVVTDFRLWCARRAERLRNRTLDLAEVFIRLARRHARAVVPEYTHGQRAQVTVLGHHLLGHVFPLLRDAARFEAARAAAARCALGSGACAGVAYPYDRERVARELHMAPAIESALDAVSDRDFAADLLYACTTCAGHLSRLGAEWILWASAEFGFVSVPEAFASGSSIMPQKRNPDAAELLRGLAPGVVGDLCTLLNLTSRIPLGYSKDLQGDKPPVMQSVEAVILALDVAIGMVSGTRFHLRRMEEASRTPGLYATDLADALVARGVPFREAHEAVGRLMREIESCGRDLAPKDLRRLSPHLETVDLTQILDPTASVERRVSPGGPSREAMKVLLRIAARAVKGLRRHAGDVPTHRGGRRRRTR